MDTKQEFLEELRTALRKYPSGDVDDYIDYYDELISEHIANGQKEAAVLEGIGNPKEVAASFKKDNAIGRAVKKPTLSNGVKALIAVLSVLSLPFLVPVLAVLLALAVAGILVFGAGLVVLIAGAVAAILSVVDMAIIVHAGDAPMYLLFLVTGIALIIVFAVFEFMRGLLKLGRLITKALIRKLNTRHSRKKQQDQDVSSEEQ